MHSTRRLKIFSLRTGPRHRGRLGDRPFRKTRDAVRGAPTEMAYPSLTLKYCSPENRIKACYSGKKREGPRKAQGLTDPLYLQVDVASNDKKIGRRGKNSFESLNGTV